MKKVLVGLFALSCVAMAYEKPNVYVRVGLGHANFKKLTYEGATIIKSQAKGMAWELGLEAMYPVTKEFEAGLGVAYQYNARPKWGTQEDEVLCGSLPALKSIPLYATAKYNFPMGSEFHPYVKADLGYSFNSGKKTIKSDPDDFSMKYKNGVYYGVGIGAEYNNIVVDLMYKFTDAKIKYNDGYEVDTDKFNSKRVMLSAAYKF